MWTRTLRAFAFAEYDKLQELRAELMALGPAVRGRWRVHWQSPESLHLALWRGLRRYRTDAQFRERVDGFRAAYEAVIYPDEQERAAAARRLARWSSRTTRK